MRHRKYVLVVLSVVLVIVAGVLYAVTGENAPDERQQIDNAAKAPFADFEHRHARQFCDDFIPVVARSLARNLSPASDCQTRVAHAFALIGDEPESGERKTPILRVEVTGVVWHSGDAKATVSYGHVRSGRVWTLEKIDNEWRISTPAALEAETNCPRALRGNSCENSVSTVWLEIQGLKHTKSKDEKSSSVGNESK